MNICHNIGIHTPNW